MTEEIKNEDKNEFQQEVKQETQNTNKPKSSKLRIFIIVLGILLIASAFGYMFSGDKSNKILINSDGTPIVNGIIAKAYEGVRQTQSIGIVSSNDKTWRLKRASGSEASYGFIFLNATQFSNKLQLGWLANTNGGNKNVYYCNGSVFRDVNNNPLVASWGVNRVELNDAKKPNTANGYTIDLKASNLNGIDVSCLKLGENSSVVANVPTQSIVLDESGANINCGVEKNINGNWTPIEALWSNKYEWGLNDTYSNGVNEQYRITCNSLLPYVNINNSQYQYGQAIHDFSKTCQTANGCVFTDTNSTSMNVILNSTGFIDPTFTIPIDAVGNYVINATIESSNCTHLNIDTSQTPMNSLVGYWNFDCDTSAVAYDMTANNNDGTYTNGAYSSSNSAKIGSAGAFFDGSNDYISTGYNSIYDSTSTAFTLSAWIRVEGKPIATRWPTLVGRGNCGTNINCTGFYIQQSQNSTMLYGYWGDGRTQTLGGTHTLTFNDNANLNQWYHLVETYQWNGTTSLFSIYQNGILINSSTDSKQLYNPFTFGNQRSLMLQLYYLELQLLVDNKLLLLDRILLIENCILKKLELNLMLN